MKKFFQWAKEFLFPEPVAHDWKHSGCGMVRTCTVCGEEEEYDFGGGLSGGAWMASKRGNRAAHAAKE